MALTPPTSQRFGPTKRFDVRNVSTSENVSTSDDVETLSDVETFFGCGHDNAVRSYELSLIDVETFCDVETFWEVPTWKRFDVETFSTWKRFPTPKRFHVAKAKSVSVVVDVETF